VQPGSGVRPLVGQVEIRNLGAELVEDKNVAGPDVSMDDRRLDFLVEVLQPSRRAVGYLHSLHPVQDRPGLGALNSFLPCSRTVVHGRTKLNLLNRLVQMLVVVAAAAADLQVREMD